MKSYKSFEIFVNSFRMGYKMHIKILRTIFAAQIFFIIFFSVCILLLAEDVERQTIQNDIKRNIQAYVTGRQVNFQMVELVAWKKIVDSFWITFMLYGLYPLTLLYFSSKAHEKFTEKQKRGARLVDEKELYHITSKENYRIKLSKWVYIPQDYELRHFFIGGAPGTGKTTLINSIIHQLRGEKAIIYDAKGGELVSRFYDPKVDFIFNPFDARSVYWNIFDCIKIESDFDSLAGSIIPQTTGKEPFFNNTARSNQSGILRYCYINDLKSNEHVWEIISGGVEKIYECLDSIGHESCSYIKDFYNSTTQSVISTLVSYAQIFRYLGNSSQIPFSLGDWLSDDSKKGFLFLPCTADQAESLRGILSLFINTVSKNVLSLPDDINRRIFIIVDEFGTLAKMDAIESLFSQGRSKGCSFWLGIQEKAQIDRIYGKSSANSMLNHCNTQIVFRLNDADSSEYFSRSFGEKETEKKESTINAGVQEHKDGESYRDVTKKERIVLPSEIQALPDLNFYVKLHSLPVTRTKISYTNYPVIEKPFVTNNAFSLVNINKGKSSHTDTTKPDNIPNKDKDKNKDKGNGWGDMTLDGI